jgi:muramoyltetrapeptide carboxypeptidase
MHSSFTPRTKPSALQPGDTVGIVAPASNIKRELLDKGCEGLRQQGYRPFYFDSILEHDLYFAGSVERRVWCKLFAANARPRKNQSSS